jgi:O-antigen/teichoic acid export membrane protein
VTTVSDGPPPQDATTVTGPPGGDRLRPLLRGLQLPMWSVVQVGVQLGVALLSARWLGPGDRGDLVLSTTLATLLLLVSSLGAGAASRVVLAEADRWWNWSRYLRLAALLTGPHLALSATVGLLVLARLSSGDTALYLPFVVYSGVALSAHLLREGLHGLGRHRTTMAIDVASAGVQLLLITGAYTAGILSPEVALYAGALSYAGSIAAQVTIGRAADVLGRDRPRVSAGEWWRRAVAFVGFSRFALVAALGQSFVVNGDRLVLGAAGSPSQVGIYAAASSLAQLTWVAPVALTALLTRRTAASGTLEAWHRMHRPVLALTAVLAVAVSGLGWFAVPILLGEDFAPARAVLPILCLAAIPYASYHFDSAACAGLRDLRTGAFGALLGSLAVVGASTGGYHVLGTQGIALGVLVAYLVMAVTARVRIRRPRLSTTPPARSA